MTQFHQSAETVAEAVIREVGPNIVLGLPLGLGKANHIANALYERAAVDRSIQLTIFTALTLEKPHAKSELERRFIDPVIERLFGGYPDLAYAKALRHGAVPDNIEVNEFFFLAGRWLSVDRAQQSYISANYTHAARYLVERGVNVVAQLVAKKGDRYSFSCNPDTILDVLQAQKEGRAKFLIAAQVNSELPFMPGDAEQPLEAFAHVLDSPSTDFPLFAPPREPLNACKYAIGIHAARLVADGGTLQIGIGEEGDAAVRALILRHHENDAFRDAVSRLTNGATPLAIEHNGTFEQGLYGVSEMFVDGFLQLMDAGILKREVDGALLHGAFFLGPKILLQAPARDAAGDSREIAHDRSVVHQRTLWRSGCQDPRAGQGAVHQQCNDGDAAGRGRFGRAGKRTRGQRRRRPAQFRDAGLRTARCALDPNPQFDAQIARCGAIQCPLVLWPHHDPAP